MTRKTELSIRPANTAPSPSPKSAVATVLASAHPVRRFLALALDASRMQHARRVMNLEIGNPHHVPSARSFLARFGSPEIVRVRRAEIADDLDQETDVASADQVACLILDSIPAARKAGDCIIDAIAAALVYAEPEDGLNGFGKIALGLALGDILSAHKFTPAPAEVLAAAKSARGRMRNALWTSRALPSMAEHAEWVILGEGIDIDIEF